MKSRRLNRSHSKGRFSRKPPAVTTKVPRLNEGETARASVAESDRYIADRALVAIRWLTTIPDEEIRIAVERGDVTLLGTVQTLTQQKMVVEIVGKQSGVKTIKNRLTIREQPERVISPCVAASAADRQMCLFPQLYDGSD